MRVCKECDNEYEDFGLRHKLCRPCKQAYDRQFHANRSPEARARKIKLQAERKDIARQFVWDYLSTHPCELCPESDPIVLEFDHLDRSTKSGNVCEMRFHSLATVKKEIEKCRVLCANCHRRHTAKQLGWYKGLNLSLA